MDWMSSIVTPIVGGVAKGLTSSMGAPAGGGGGGGSSVSTPDFTGFMMKPSDAKVDTRASQAAPVTNHDAMAQKWAAMFQSYKG
jgi:hypothetical protein